MGHWTRGVIQLAQVIDNPDNMCLMCAPGKWQR